MPDVQLFGPRLRGNLSRALHEKSRIVGTRKGVLYEISKRTEVNSGQLRLPASGGGTFKEKPYRWSARIGPNLFGDTAATVYECLNQIEAAAASNASKTRKGKKAAA